MKYLLLLILVFGCKIPSNPHYPYDKPNPRYAPAPDSNEVTKCLEIIHKFTNLNCAEILGNIMKDKHNKNYCNRLYIKFKKDCDKE